MLKQGLAACLAISALVGCVGCGGGTKEEPTIVENQSEVISPSQPSIILTTSGEVTVLGGKVTDGSFKEITIKTNDVEQGFRWSNVSNSAYFPALYVSDVNQDGNEEIVVILTTGYGTGALQQEIHVLDKSNLTEIQIEDALSYVNEHAESSITKQDGTVRVEVRIMDQMVKKQYEESEIQSWNDKVGFGSIVSYSVEDHIITASIAGGVSPAEFPFTIQLTYGPKLTVDRVAIHH